MARLVDNERRTELLDRVVVHLGEHGLAGLSLRPLAADLGVSVNTLTHHFGSRDDLIVAALRRSGEIQQEVEQRWLGRSPNMTQAELLRSWWRWMTSSPRNLSMVRLGIEATALEATLGGLPRSIRGEQIGLWRENIEERLVAEGVPREIAVEEASLTKAMFTGLVVDLLATGQRTRLTRALDLGIARLEQVVCSHASARSRGH